MLHSNIRKLLDFSTVRVRYMLVKLLYKLAVDIVNITINFKNI